MRQTFSIFSTSYFYSCIMKQICLGLLALFLVACNNNDKVTESALLAKGISLDLAEFRAEQLSDIAYHLSLIHISEPTRPFTLSRMPSSA